MAGRDTAAGTVGFAERFPDRFGLVLAEARGALSGLAASARVGEGVIHPDSLRRLHAVFRLRIELELEAAAVLWQAAEVVCALADATEALQARRAAERAPPEEWLSPVPAASVNDRGARRALRDDAVRRRYRWPDVRSPASPDGAHRPPLY